MEFYDLPLIQQGFTTSIPAAGDTARNQFTLSTGRGRIFQIEPWNFASGFAVDPNSNLSVRAGGQFLIQQAPLQNYHFANPNTKRITKVRLAESQTLDTTLVAGLTASQAQVIAYYTNNKHEEFKRNFKWGTQLGLKEQAFQFTFLPVGQQEFEIIIPKRSGNIVGFSMDYMSPITALVAVQTTLSINDQAIYKNISAMRDSLLSQADKAFHPVAIAPGSTAQLEVNNASGLTGEVAVTFYFDN